MEICPHLPEVGCACRKPAPAMAARAAEALGGDLSSSVVVGDKAADMELARGIGAAAVLVRTGYGEGTEVSMGDRSAHLVLNNIGELLPWLERGAEGIRAAAEGREAIP
jgi:histidinol phosphatase-like enzyme